MEKVDENELRMDTALPSLDKGTQAIVQAILQGNTDLSATIAAQTFESIKREDAREAAAIRRHDEVIARIDRLPYAVGTNIAAAKPKMDRHDIIKPAHRKTFDWVFQRPEMAHVPWPNLDEWLRTMTRVCWISGKAGSGKFTLMKYLIQDLRLRQALESWADTFPRALRYAFTTLTTQSEIPVKITIIIDGLDEFEPTSASYTELADIFLTATRSANVKTVLSSRPLCAFEASFAGSRNFDELADLRQRLKAIPRDLEDLFVRMLHQIPSEYKMQSSRMFQILLYNASDESNASSMRRAYPLTAMGMFFTEFSVEKILEAPINRIPYSELRRRVKEIEGRLRSRCAGLVELRCSQSVEDNPADDGKLKQSVGLAGIKETGLPSESPFMGQDAEVQYLHRSVADWLQKKNVWDTILEGTRTTNFNPHVSILQSLVMRLKCSPPASGIPSNGYLQFLHHQWDIVNAVIHFAMKSEATTGKAQVAILDELDRVMSIYHEDALKDLSSAQKEEMLLPVEHESWCDTLMEDYQRPVPWHDTFLAFSIRHGLVFYVQAKIQANGGALPNKKGRPLLDYAGRPVPSDRHWHAAINPDIVKCLLEHGADPNEKFNGFSPWQNALYNPTDDFSRWIRILNLLVQHGADTQTYIETASPRGDLHWETGMSKKRLTRSPKICG
ncbi:hypothetical protein BCR34DRAFT_598123 [Clohesyomyces aquaticus]|uniref:NACHT domain-containing protein n=1 Tax=Clohesyomyces aquaticus TaxID=1231657 RepID=A0A1Y2A015_9PLEO|nr:hypothetical protein BCR34DRAFT_598123 [Clohesyomyces aquaticus]